MYKHPSCVCRNASQIHTPALAARQVDARAPCMWHLCQRVLLRKQESSQNVPLDLKSRPLGGHTYGFLRTCTSPELCSLQSLIHTVHEALQKCSWLALPCHFSTAKETSLPQSYLLGERHVGDSGNIHVGTGTLWQHRACPTLVKNLHCFWTVHVLP